MLASTVQFSNNDQPPITPGTTRSSLGPAYRRTGIKPVPSDTQQRARHSRSRSDFHAEAVLTEPNQPCRIVNVPPMSNQHRTLADELAWTACAA